MKRLCAAVLSVAASLVPLFAQQPATTSALRIVVVEGEGGVNIIQQKTAVRPLVEVRDRNNVPVAGASVTFTIAGGGGHAAAFAGGAQTLTVTTNAAGQAAASGFNALSSGAFQIQVQAAYQGQIATAAISQTNFATAAAAAQAGAAAGGGGGISGTTIGIVGAAVAGGAVAATQLGGNSSDSEPISSPDPNSVDVYDGSFSGPLTLNSEFTPTVGPLSLCTFTNTLTGTLKLELKRDGTGFGSMQGTMTMTSATSTCVFDPTPHGLSVLREQALVTGGPSAPTFTATFDSSFQIQTWRFSGTLSGNTISGALSYNVAPAAGANPRYVGSTSMPITLTGPQR